MLSLCALVNVVHNFSRTLPYLQRSHLLVCFCAPWTLTFKWTVLVVSFIISTIIIIILNTTISLLVLSLLV